MTNADMDEALDWLGRPVDCKACRYADRLADGKCQEDGKAEAHARDDYGHRGSPARGHPGGRH